jgi:hypothetical protein
LLLTLAGAAAFDQTKYPDWSGTWKRAPGAGIGWDETKPRGRAQQPPLTPEYQAIWEASMADQDAGGQGNDTRVTCISNGMPSSRRNDASAGRDLRPAMFRQRGAAIAAPRRAPSAASHQQ